MKVSCVIVDDELASIQSLQYDISKINNELEVVATFCKPFEALEFLRKTEIDLLFLDLNMPGLHGFQLLEQLDEIRFQIIFITAHEEYALQAFEFNAVDYILKPTMRQKLSNAIDKACEQLSPFDNNSLNALSNNMKLRSGHDIGKIAIPTSYGWDFVLLNDIIHLQADGNYTRIFLINGDHYVAKTLKSFEEMLRFDIFFRAHQSHLVNLNHVSKFIRADGGTLELTNGREIPVARSRKEALYERMRF